MDMSTHHPKHLSVAVLFFLLAITTVLLSWVHTNTFIDATTAQVIEASAQDMSLVEGRKNHILPKQVKGIYLTAYSAGNKQKVGEIISLIDTTELNAVVIDIKDYSGKILYDSHVPLARQIGAVSNQIGDVRALIRQFHDHNIYMIARQTVFQDPLLARKKTDLAIKSKQGGLWYDYKGLSWVDASHEEIWAYNVAIAKEAAMLGFDEINFDYVRFPSDGNMSLMVYAAQTEKTKNDVMKEFYTYLGREMTPTSAFISLDLFGFSMERHDGMSIGQRIEDAVNNVDAVSPMMYPSHYPSGHLGLENPAAHPGIVIDNGMKKGTPYFVDTRAQVRPWLQAFNLGATYDASKIRAQIDMVEKYPNNGWLLWNASNRYTTAGLKTAEQVRHEEEKKASL